MSTSPSRQGVSTSPGRQGGVEFEKVKNFKNFENLKKLKKCKNLTWKTVLVNISGPKVPPAHLRRNTEILRQIYLAKLVTKTMKI